MYLLKENIWYCYTYNVLKIKNCDIYQIFPKSVIFNLIGTADFSLLVMIY